MTTSKLLAGVAIVLLAAVAGAAWWSLGRNSALDLVPRTPRDGQVAVPGLDQPSRVITDRWGIPHIEAGNLPDLYLAWGFVTARDRLWQLEHARRAARGELWRWFGNRALRDDGGAQLFELQSRAARIWAREAEDPRVREPLERYTAGVNAYLALCREGAEPWPVEFARLDRYPDDWTPEDAVLLLLAQGLVLDLQIPELAEAKQIEEHGAEWPEERHRFEDRQLYRTIPDTAAVRLHGAGGAAARSAALPEAVRSGPRPLGPIARRLVEQARLALGGWLLPPDPAGELRASNVFAVGPARSTRGRPLLANDPHLSFRTPGPFHVVHLSVPGEVEAVGAAVPGLPAIVSGRNRDCAWGITALSADVIDLYADTLSANGRQVRWNGGWHDIRREDFTMRYRVLGLFSIPVLGQDRRYTPHGPVLALDRNQGVALSARWAGDDRDVTLRRLLGLERSRSAEEVTERFRSLVTPGINVIAADVGGRVIYQAAGAAPRRGFTAPRGPLPGDGRHEWNGTLPAAEMPRWQAPPDGFVVNANNLPVGNAYPEPWPRFDWAHDRALRIAQRLAEVSQATIEDLADIQNDLFSRRAERHVPLLLACADSVAHEWSPRAQAALDTLRGWDFIARRGAVAPTLYAGWYGALQRRSRLGGLHGLAEAALDGRAPDALREPKGKRLERASDAAVRALEQALVEMAKTLGPDLGRWQWARAHQARFPHALAWKDRALEPPPVAADGDHSTPCVGRSYLPDRVTFSHGPVFRHIVDLAVPDSSLGVVPPGNSGDPRSGHARDHLEPWADHKYVPLYLSWHRIEAARESELRLAPEPSSHAPASRPRR